MKTVRPFVPFAAADPEHVRAGQVPRASSVPLERGFAMMPTTGQAHLSQPMDDLDARTLDESAIG